MQDPTSNSAHKSGERAAQPMLWIGERCHREDFLPFKCQDCRNQ